MFVTVTFATKTSITARNVRKRRGWTRTRMAETKIAHRRDGLYDLTIKDGNTYIIKHALTMQEVVYELEQELYQWEEDTNGGAE